MPFNQCQLSRATAHNEFVNWSWLIPVFSLFVKTSNNGPMHTLCWPHQLFWGETNVVEEQREWQDQALLLILCFSFDDTKRCLSQSCEWQSCLTWTWIHFSTFITVKFHWTSHSNWQNPHKIGCSPCQPPSYVTQLTGTSGFVSQVPTMDDVQCGIRRLVSLFEHFPLPSFHCILLLSTSTFCVHFASNWQFENSFLFPFNTWQFMVQHHPIGNAFFTSLQHLNHDHCIESTQNFSMAEDNKHSESNANEQTKTRPQAPILHKSISHKSRWQSGKKRAHWKRMEAGNTAGKTEFVITHGIQNKTTNWEKPLGQMHGLQQLAFIGEKAAKQNNLALAHWQTNYLSLEQNWGDQFLCPSQLIVRMEICKHKSPTIQVNRILWLSNHHAKSHHL